jgi:hypothetical protein
MRSFGGLNSGRSVDVRTDKKARGGASAMAAHDNGGDKTKKARSGVGLCDFKIDGQ